MSKLRFGAIVLTSLIALAAQTRADDKAAARVAYNEGTKHYDLSEFTEALDAFKRAYWHYEEPAFLFNIAQCYRQLGQKTEAVKFYRTYLRKLPEAENSEDVKRIVANLEAAIASETAAAASQRATARPAVEAEPPKPTVVVSPSRDATSPALLLTRDVPVKKKPIYKKWWLWTAAGIVVAGVAIGLGVGLTQTGSTQVNLNPVHVP